MTWVSNAVPSDTWRCIASSADGNHLAAASAGRVTSQHLTIRPPFDLAFQDVRAAVSSQSVIDHLSNVEM
jgi:hypothetical protein